MKHYLFVLLFISVSTTLSAQGLTRFGEIKSGSSNDFVDKYGRLGSIPMLDANGKVLFELTTTTVSTITNITANTGGNVFSLSPITARGVCWSTSPAPTVALVTKTSDGAGDGVFTSAITGLASGVLYYVRAYATNVHGTGYGNEVSFTSAVSDIDGNVYSTVTIGTQVWMVENLKTTKLNDGTSIPLVTDNNEWINLPIPGYCWNNNDATNKDTYGALYNWLSVNTGKLAPAGWHVATDAEWTKLTTFLGGLSVAGGALKEAGTAHWIDPNEGATNSSGFSALPGGFRWDQGYDGFFYPVGVLGMWWSATGSSPPNNAWILELNYYNANAYPNNDWPIMCGSSVRCVRD